MIAIFLIGVCFGVGIALLQFIIAGEILRRKNEKERAQRIADAMLARETFPQGERKIISLFAQRRK